MDWLAALTAALQAWKTTAELAAKRAVQKAEDEKKAADAVANLPDPTPPKKET